MGRPGRAVRRPRRPWRAVALAVVVAALGPGASAARAHPGHLGIRADRYLKLEVSPKGLRLVVSLTLGPVAATRWLRAADTNGDGKVSEAEAEASMKRWTEALDRELPVEIDGKGVKLRWTNPFLDPIGEIDGRPATVEMTGLAALDGGRHHIVLRDKMLQEAFDRTDVAIEAVPPARLLAAGPGERPDERLRRFAVVKGERLDAVGVLVELPGEQQAERRRFGTYLALGALAVLGLAVWLGARRRRKHYR